MGKSTRVAIGLPVFNGENYLEQAIESILAQTFGGFRLLICDNHSSDRTEEICRHYQKLDDRITYYRHEKNIGAAPNFNFAFEKSDAKYFKWAAHDDLMEKNYLAETVPLLDAHPDAAIAHGRSLVIDRFGTVLGNFDGQVCLGGDLPSQRFKSILWAGYFTEVFGLMRSETVARTKLHSRHPGSDRNFMAELVLRGDVVYSTEVIFRRRSHPESYVEGLPNNKLRQAFMDPSKRLTLPPFFFRVKGYLSAIDAAPISARERAACRKELAGWASACVRHVVTRRTRGPSMRSAEENLADLITRRGLETLEGALSKQRSRPQTGTVPETVSV